MDIIDRVIDYITTFEIMTGREPKELKLTPKEFVQIENEFNIFIDTNSTENINTLFGIKIVSSLESDLDLIFNANHFIKDQPNELRSVFW